MYGVLLSALLAFGAWFGSPAFAQDLVATPENEVVLGAAPDAPLGFEHVAGRSIDVYGHPEQLKLLTRIADQGSDSVERLAERLGVPIGGRISVFLAANDAEFRALQPGRVPEWADGTAWPDRGTVFLRAPAARGSSPRPLDQVLDHELIHVLLGRAFAPHEPPRWLQEGLARVYANEHGPEQTAILADALLTGTFFTLPELHHAFPRDPRGANIAYAESSDFVSWLQADAGSREAGDERIRRVIRRLAAGSSVDAAVYDATGRTMAEVSREWRSSLDDSGLWLSALSAEQVLWGATGALAAAAVIAHRGRFRRRMEAYAEAERERDRVAAWAGPPVYARRRKGLPRR